MQWNILQSMVSKASSSQEKALRHAQILRTKSTSEWETTTRKATGERSQVVSPRLIRRRFNSSPRLDGTVVWLSTTWFWQQLMDWYAAKKIFLQQPETKNGQVGCFPVKQRISDEVASKVVALGVRRSLAMNPCHNTSIVTDNHLEPLLEKKITKSLSVGFF